MKERPILFSGPMVRAILDGSKTQTRRVAKEFDEMPNLDGVLQRFPRQNGCPYGAPGDQEWRTGHITASGWYYVRGLLDESIGGDTRAVWVNPEWFTWGFGQDDDPESIGLDTNITPENVQWKSAGDRLWVRETWQHNIGNGPPLIYRADHGAAQSVYEADLATGAWKVAVSGWRPSIFMPRSASRILLEITDVRVQRLQEISEGDARAEGVSDGGCLSCGNPEPCGCGNPQPDARDGFAWLWQSIHGTGSWHVNPWVWAITFRRIQP
jgi:hypothetical protein